LLKILKSLCLGVSCIDYDSSAPLMGTDHMSVKIWELSMLHICRTYYQVS
jgi:hypothetical protein